MENNRTKKLGNSKRSSPLKNKRGPLVSVIIPTRNSAQFLNRCLQSIKNQTYKNIEIIVVDNNSTDNTKEIAKKYTKLVFNKGPERSAQRNWGAKQSKGEYLLFIDSDMEVTSKVVEECVKKVSAISLLNSLVIPEKSVGEGFWAECKALERSFYVGVDWMEAARFFSRDSFVTVGGYDEQFTGSEDYDLPLRIVDRFGTNSQSRINEYIVHNEGKLSLRGTMKKKYYYSRELKIYQNRHTRYYQKQSSLIARYLLFFSNPAKLFERPLIGIGMLFMKTAEFVAGGCSYLFHKLK